MLFGFPVIGTTELKGERRSSPRKESDYSVQFRFVMPLPLIVTKMFNLTDTGNGTIRNYSNGGVMIEIPVTIKGLSFLYNLNKALETCQSVIGLDKSLILKSTDFSTVELMVTSGNKELSTSLLGLPVWVRYFENGPADGTIKIGLKFPENAGYSENNSGFSMDTLPNT